MAIYGFSDRNTALNLKEIGERRSGRPDDVTQAAKPAGAAVKAKIYLAHTDTGKTDAVSSTSFNLYRKTDAGAVAERKLDDGATTRTVDACTPPDGFELILQDPSGNYWKIATSSSTSPNKFVRADAHRLPGFSNAAFSELSWNGSAWVDSTNNVQVWDSDNNNCVLSGEDIWVTSPDGGTSWFPIGEHGLRRLCTINANIGCDQSGNVTIRVNDVANGPTVTGYNTWPGGHRALRTGHNASHALMWDKTQLKWIIEPDQMAMFIEATLSADLIPGQSLPSITGVTNLDWLSDTCGNISSPTWTNPRNRAGASGDKIILMRRIDGATHDAWEVLDVKRQQVILPGIDPDQTNSKILRVQDVSGTDRLQSYRNKVFAEFASADGWTTEVDLEDCP